MLGRSLLMKASGARLLYPTYVQDYLDRVTAADVAAGNTLGLELGVTDAFNTCLQAMVADTSLGVSGGVLAQAASLIKASCAMQGARTLPGALVPLAADMPAPTNVGPFVAGDYNRRTGLGDPANVSKYLNSNQTATVTSATNTHQSVFVTTKPTVGAIFSGSDNLSNQRYLLYYNLAANETRAISGAVGLAYFGGAGSLEVGFKGVSRDNSLTFVGRSNASSSTVTSASANTALLNSFIFAVNTSGSANSHSNARLNFYSIGSALDLAILDARITALSNAIQAAIP